MHYMIQEKDFLYRVPVKTAADADKYLPLTGGTMKGDILSPSYKKIGGTDEQILLADGSIATAIDTDTFYVNSINIVSF